MIELDIKDIWEKLGTINGTTYEEELLDDEALNNEESANETPLADETDASNVTEENTDNQ